MSAHERDRLSAYLDGELPPAERAEVETHLRACEACSERLAELAAVDGAARELPLPVPDGYFETFPARLRPRLRAKRPVVLARPWTLAAAAALFLAVLAPWLLRQAPPRLEPPAPEAAPASRPAEEARDALARQEADRAGATGARSEAEKRKESAAESMGRVRPPAPAPLAPARPAGQGPGKLQEGPAVPEVAAGLEGGLTDEAQQAAPSEGGFAAAPPAAAPPRVAAAHDAGAAAPVEAEKKAEQDAEKGQRAARASAENRARDAQRDAEARRRQDSSLAATRETSEVEDEAAALRRRPAAASLAEARSRRDAWRALALRASGPLADEARFHAVELGVRAFELGSDPADRAAARRDAETYLARPDATRAPHVRALLASLGD